MSKSIYLHFTLFKNNEIFNWIGVGQIFIPKKKMEGNGHSFVLLAYKRHD